MSPSFSSDIANARVTVFACVMAETEYEEEAREIAIDAAYGEGKATFSFAPLTKPPAGLPPAWKKVLTDKSPTTAALALWKPIAKTYPKTFRVLERTLQRVGLLTTAKRGHSLIYLFELEDDGGATLRRGYPPAKKLPKSASRLARDFVALYAVHDGWLDEDAMMGPRRSADWAPLGTTGPSRDFLVTFEGHGPATLGFDLSEKDAPCYRVWTNDKPERARKVAATIDDWMAVQMEEFTPTRSAKKTKTKRSASKGRRT